MSTAESLESLLANIKHDPEKEDNWTPLTEFLRDQATVVAIPGGIETIDTAIAYFERYGDWDYSARLLSQRFELEPDQGKKADLALKLAKIYDEATFQGKKAREAYEEVLRLRPGDEEANKALGRLKQLKDKWRDVVEQYLREANDADQAAFKSNLHLQIAGLYNKFGGKSKNKIADVLHYLQLALEADPGNRYAYSFLKRILVQDRQWDELIALFQRLAEVAKTREDRVDALVQRARILATKMDRSDEAAEIYAQVLDVQPGNQAAMAFLVDWYAASGQSEHLVALYEDMLKMHPKGDEELATLLQIAMVHWRMRGEIEQAEGYFRKVRRIQANHPAALNFYRTVYSEQQDWLKLTQTLTEAVRGAKNDEEKIVLYREIAEVSESKMANVERSIDAWKAIVKIAPSHAAALAALKGLYRKSQKWNALLDALKQEFQASEGNVRAQVETLREIVTIYSDHLSLDPMVIKTWFQILDVDPGNAEALDALSGIFEKSKRWNDLVGILERKADRAEDPTMKVGILRRVTSIWIDELSNFNKAVEPLEKILEIEPQNLEVIGRLKKIYEQRRAWEPLFSLLEREQGLIAPKERKQHLETMASIAAERLGKHSEAIDLYWKVLEIDPGNDQVMTTIEKLCERQKRWEDLGRVLEARLERVTDEAAKVPLLVKLGGVYGEQIGDNDRALGAWKRLLVLQPTHPKALRILKDTYVQKRDWESLAALFSEHGNWEGLADVFSSTSEATEVGEDRVMLAFRAAEIYEGKLGNTQRAIRCYERVLAAEPDNREAALALLPVHEKEGNWARIADMQRVLLRTAKDDGEKRKWLGSLTEILGEKLKDARGAFETASSSYRMSPGDGDAEAALALYGEALGSWKDLVAIYRERLPSAKGDEAKRLRHSVASILLGKMSDPEQALVEYRTIIAEDPSDSTAYDAIEKILTSTGRLGELIEFYDGRLASVKEVGDRVEFWERMARIAQEGMDDPARAAQYYALVLDARPDHTAAMSELESIYRITERWEDLVGILSRRRERAEGDDLVDVVLELGKVKSAHLGRYEEAIDDFSYVLSARTGDREAVEALEGLLGKEDHRLRVAELLADHLAPLEKFTLLVSVTHVLLDAAKDPERRLDLFTSLAHVQNEHLGSAGAGYDVLAQALAEFPGSERLWDGLEDLAGRTSRWADLRGKLDAIFEAEGTGDDTRLALARRLASMSVDRLGDQAAAERYHRWVYDRNPLDDGSFAALDSFFSGSDRYADLKSLYRVRADAVADTTVKVDLLQKIGFIEEDLLEDPKGAIGTYREILGISPDHEVAQNALERLYESTSAWADLVDLLEGQIDRVPADSVVAAWYRLGDILDHRLGEKARALEYYRRVLDQYPTHLKTQEALEGLLTEANLRQGVAGILEGIYESQGANADLARILAVRLEGASVDQDKVDLLLKLAGIQEKRLKDGDAAYETLAKAFAIDPGREDIRTQLEQIVEQNDLWAVYVEELESISRKLKESSILGPILFDLGNIYLTRLGNDEQALQTFNRYLESGHDDPVIMLGATRALESLHAARENHADLVHVLSLQLSLLEEPDRKVDNLRRIGEIREAHLDRPEEAITTYLEILDLAPGDIDSMLALERLYERTGKWEDLVGILRRRMDAGASPGEWRSICFKIAETFRDKLENLDEAVFTYLTVLEKGPDTDALLALTDLYDRTGADRDLVDALGRLHDLASDPAEKASILFRMGEVERERIKSLDAAVDRYREVLEIDPSHAGAREVLEKLAGEEDVRLVVARILAPLFEHEENYRRLLDMIDIEIAESQSQQDRDRMLRKAAEVAEIGMSDPERAFTYYAKALRLIADNPESASVVQDLERIAAESKSWEALVDLYSQVAPDVYDQSLQLKLFLRVADLELTELGRLDSARDWYVKVLDVAPDSMVAIEALERIYWQQEAFTSLLEILRRKTDLVQDPVEKSGLLFRQAEICEDKLQDPALAIEAFEAILEIEENRDAVHALERLYERTERWGNLRDIVERQLEWPDANEIHLHHRLGVILSVHLGDPQSALDHFKEALRLDPKHAPTVDILESWLEDSAFREQVAEMLEPIYLAAMRLDKVQSIIKVRLEFVKDPAVRRDLFQRLGVIFEEQLEDLDAAFGVYARMYEENPEDVEIRGHLDRLGNVLDAWPRVAETYQRVLDDRLTEDAITGELARHLGRIYDSNCSNPDGAVKVFRRALTIDPADQEAFNSLEMIFHREERWEDLYNLYRDVADGQTDAEVRRNLLYHMGQLSEEKLGDRAKAIDIFREVLDLEQGDPIAIQSLDRLYYYEKRFHDLADLLRMRIDRAPNAQEQLELKYRLATLHDEHLGDRAGAIDLCEEILGQDTAYLDAVAALETMLDDADHRHRVAQILIPIYREQQDWAQLQNAYKVELEFLTEPIDRIERLREAATIAESRQSNPGAAMDAWSLALMEDPSDAEVVGHMQRLAQQLERWGDLVQVFEKAIERTDMSSIRSGLTRLSARILDRHMGEFERAVAAYRRLLEEEEGDMEALEALDSLYTMLGNWEGLLSAIDLKVRYTMDQEIARNLRRRQGEIAEDQLGDQARAIGYHVQALELDQADVVTLDNLERLYEQASRWEDLESILEQKLSALQDPAARREVLLKTAAVQKDRLDNGEKAIRAYESVLEESPADVGIMRILDDLYAKTERWDDLYANLDRRVAATTGDREVQEILLEMGRLLVDRLGDVERAIEVLRRVLSIGPDGRAFAALESIAGNEEHRPQVIAILEPIYRRAGNWDKLLVLMRMQLEIISDPTGRIDMRMQIADLEETGIGDRGAAFATLIAAVGEDLWSEDLYRKVEVKAEQLERWKEFAEALERKVSSIYDASVSSEINARLGRIWEERLGDAGKAIEAYRRILDQGVDESHALDCLDRLYYQSERWEDLAFVIRKKMDAAQDPHAQDVLGLRLGEMRDQRFHDLAGAIKAYSEVLERTQDQPDAIQALESLLDRGDRQMEIVDLLASAYRAGGHTRKLLDLLDMKASLYEDKDERVSVLREEARLAEDELKDPEAAFQAYGKALWEAPDDKGIMDEIERLAEMLDGWEPLSDHVARILAEREPDPDVRKDMTLRLARWSKDRLRNSAEAVKWYAAYLDATPDDVEALREYEQALDSMGKNAELLDVMERREGLEYDFETKKGLLRRIAEVAADRAGDPARAANAWEALVGMDEADVAAVDALLAICATTENWKRTIELLEIRILHTPDAAEANRHRHRLADLLVTVKNDREKAIEILQEVMAADPADEVAGKKLEDLYEATGKWYELKELIVAGLDRTSDPALRAHSVKRLADLAEKRFEDMDEAVRYLQEAYAIDPLDGDVLAGLERLLTGTGRLDDLISLLERRAAEVAGSDSATELALLVRIGEIYRKELQDPGRAVEYFEKVLERKPNHTLALSALADLHEQSCDWQKCITVLDKAAQTAEDTKAMGDIFYRIGLIKRDRMGDVAGAMESFNAVLEVYPEHRAVLGTLKEYFAKEEDWGRYAAILEAEERVTTDPEAKVAILLELASLMRDKLHAPDQALGYLEQANFMKPGSVEILTMLVDAYILAGRTTDAIPLIEALIKAEETKSGKRSKSLAVFHHRLGMAYEKQGDVARAISEYEAANKIDLTNFSVNFSLGKLYHSQGKWDDSMKLMRPLLLQNLGADLDKADVYHLLAECHMQKGEKPKALSMIERGLAVNKGHAGLKDLATKLKG